MSYYLGLSIIALLVAAVQFQVIWLWLALHADKKERMERTKALLDAMRKRGQL